MASGTCSRIDAVAAAPVSAVRVRYGDMKADDRTHLEQFVRDQESWKAELSS